MGKFGSFLFFWFLLVFGPFGGWGLKICLVWWGFGWGVEIIGVRVVFGCVCGLVWLLGLCLGLEFWFLSLCFIF
jgi:hypothetical protein